MTLAAGTHFGTYEIVSGAGGMGEVYRACAGLRELTEPNVVLNWFEELKRLVPTN